MPSVETLLIFGGCVAAASYVQNLTGFALGLVLLGLVGMLQIVPLADATNASSVLAVVNALVFFRSDPEPPPWKLMRHTLPASLLGVLLGVPLLAWLSVHGAQWLRLLLGVAVVGSALLLVLRLEPRKTPSRPSAFGWAGLLAGIMGGLFATSGPPVVYLMYRQPFELQTIRRCLVLVFLVNSVFRLALVVSAGRFSMLSLVLSVCAMPVVFLVTRLSFRYPPRASRQTVSRVAAVLLVLTGVSLLGASVGSLLG